MFGFLKRKTLRKAEEKPDWRFCFAQQNEWEHEGVVAALRGKAEADNPYGKDSEAWNFWIYGYDQAKAEEHTLRRGVLTTMYVDQDHHVTGEVNEDLREAYERGRWQPKFVNVPADWRAPETGYVCTDD